MLEAFDRREVGYDRVEIEKKHCDLASYEDSTSDSTVLNIQPHEKIWVYVPQKSYCQVANEQHPILQSYVGKGRAFLAFSSAPGYHFSPGP